MAGQDLFRPGWVTPQTPSQYSPNVQSYPRQSQRSALVGEVAVLPIRIELQLVLPQSFGMNKSVKTLEHGVNGLFGDGGIFPVSDTYKGRYSKIESAIAFIPSSTIIRRKR